LQKVGNIQVENEVIELLKKTPMPVSIDYVAYHLSISWPTARGLLLNMALNKKVEAIKTTRGYIFSSLEEEPTPQNDKAMTKQ